MLSVTIIAKDAAPLLPECLSSLVGLTDDIVVVVDDRTRDNTAEIAHTAGAKVFIRKFDNFSDQKNFAITQAKHDWVLSLDADEYLSPQLIEEINRLKYSKSGYLIPRKNIIFGKTINHTNWDPNGILRLFDKTQGKFQGDVHEQWESGGSVGKLTNPIIHHNYATVEQFLDKMNLYTTIEAKKSQFNPVSLIIPPLKDFIRRYFWHKGFLDGYHGLFLSYLMVVYHITTAVKAWQNSQTNK